MVEGVNDVGAFEKQVVHGGLLCFSLWCRSSAPAAAGPDARLLFIIGAPAGRFFHRSDFRQRRSGHLKRYFLRATHNYA